jgi:hypothetical protein
MKCLDCNKILELPKTGRKPIRCKPCANLRTLQKVKTRYFKKHRELKQKVFEKLGNKCNVCNEKDSIVFQIDHINNDGAKDRKVFKNISAFYTYILNNNPPVQILCCNCNWRKEYYRRNGE